MKVKLLLAIIALTSSVMAQKTVKVRVAAYNVEFSRNATAEQIGEMFKPYKLDLIGFNEAPDGDWTEKIGKVLGMKYSYVGKISSANHKNKYKTILSRTPIITKEEFKITGKGWNPSSTVKITTKIEGIDISFYSLHICASRNHKGHAHFLAENILPKDKSSVTLVTGDFNNRIEDKALKYILDKGFQDTWSAINFETKDKFTWNAYKGKKTEGVIDHIFFKSQQPIKVKKADIIELEKPLSDHKPVWAEFLIKK